MMIVSFWQEATAGASSLAHHPPWSERRAIEARNLWQAVEDVRGRSRGGFGTRLHVCPDAFGLPVRLIPGPGQQNDMALYKERNRVETFFKRIKPCRRIATRYDKLAETFMGFVVLASIMLWPR
jgi:hypothetical protein